MTEKISSNGQKLTMAEFEKQVAEKLKPYAFLNLTEKHAKLCRKLYKQGYTIANAAGVLILNSKSSKIRI